MSLATQQYHTIAICVIEIDSRPKKNKIKKLNKDGHVVRKDYLVVFAYCFRILFRDAVFQYNDSSCKGKVPFLLKELQESWGTENVAANKVTTK